MVPILVGSHTGCHAGWFPCWLVPILVGSHTGWFPYCTTYKIFVIRDIGIPPFLRDYILFFNKIRSSHTSYRPLKCRCHESQRFSMTCWLVPIRAGLNILIVILNGRRYKERTSPLLVIAIARHRHYSSSPLFVITIARHHPCSSSPLLSSPLFVSRSVVIHYRVVVFS